MGAKETVRRGPQNRKKRTKRVAGKCRTVARTLGTRRKTPALARNSLEISNNESLMECMRDRVRTERQGDTYEGFFPNPIKSPFYPKNLNDPSPKVPLNVQIRENMGFSPISESCPRSAVTAVATTAVLKWSATPHHDSTY